MGSQHAEVFRQLREEVLARLVEVRGSIDHAYASIPEATIRPQFAMVLDKMDSFLSTGSVESYRGFASRWMAMRVAAGFSPENLIHSIVAIGDVVIQVARNRLGQGQEHVVFSRAVAEMSFVAARMLVELLAEELEGRTRQSRALTEQGA